METIEEFPTVDGKSDKLEGILVMLEAGDKMLHGLKEKLDYAKRLFDEAREHFDKEEWGMCIGALIASAAVVESMETGENPADIFTRMGDEFRTEGLVEEDE